uniref:uncharacterized protein LOC122772788 n=1 Tax=Solea senegalensis TaxID=28829 RepID=UPI001CD8450F|nr:uncharacterized protein LOC122772788 [Solea senegalensis]
MTLNSHGSTTIACPVTVLQSSPKISTHSLTLSPATPNCGPGPAPSQVTNLPPVPLLLSCSNTQAQAFVPRQRETNTISKDSSQSQMPSSITRSSINGNFVPNQSPPEITASKISLVEAVNESKSDTPQSRIYTSKATFYEISKPPSMEDLTHLNPTNHGAPFSTLYRDKVTVSVMKTDQKLPVSKTHSGRPKTPSWRPSVSTPIFEISKPNPLLFTASPAFNCSQDLQVPATQYGTSQLNLAFQTSSISKPPVATEELKGNDDFQITSNIKQSNNSKEIKIQQNGRSTINVIVGNTELHHQVNLASSITAPESDGLKPTLMEPVNSKLKTVAESEASSLPKVPSFLTLSNNLTPMAMISMQTATSPSPISSANSPPVFGARKSLTSLLETQMTLATSKPKSRSTYYGLTPTEYVAYGGFRNIASYHSPAVSRVSETSLNKVQTEVPVHGSNFPECDVRKPLTGYQDLPSSLDVSSAHSLQSLSSPKASQHPADMIVTCSKDVFEESLPEVHSIGNQTLKTSNMDAIKPEIPLGSAQKIIQQSTNEVSTPKASYPKSPIPLPKAGLSLSQSSTPKQRNITVISAKSWTQRQGHSEDQSHDCTDESPSSRTLHEVSDITCIFNC